MNIIVIYSSSTGFTKKYATWISEELQCDISALENTNTELIQAHDLIIFGGGILTGKINGLEKFKRLINNSEKEYIFFATGATPQEGMSIDEMRTNNGIDINTGLFYFQSGVNYDVMKWGSRAILRVLYSILKLKKEKSEAEQEMADMISQSSDYSNKEKIVPLIEAIRKSCSKQK